MLVGSLFAILCGGLLFAAIFYAFRANQQEMRRLLLVLMGGFVIRVAIQFVIRDIQFFSHAAGGDCQLYEEYGQVIAKLWRVVGIHFVQADEVGRLGATTLPQNIFAFIIYLNNGETCRLGCTSIVALAAGLAALNVYALALHFGAEKKNALLITTIIYFQPAFLFYTSDLYKDGLVVCLTLGALGSALRLAYKFSILHAFIGIVSIVMLWYVRFYLIFLTVAPLLVGLAGIGGKRWRRSIGVAFALAIAAIVVASFTDVFQLANERATSTFDIATSSKVIASNGRFGSGVQFDDGGSPTGALPAKLAYTLFSPFPWAGGSMGFQVGKLDGFLWYFILYRAIRAIKNTDRRLVIMLATFAVPCTVTYAMTMANVGLIVRQRLVIVIATSILAATYRPKKVEAMVAKPVVRRRPTAPLPGRT